MADFVVSRGQFPILIFDILLILLTCSKKFDVLLNKTRDVWIEIIKNKRPEDLNVFIISFLEGRSSLYSIED